MGSVYVFGRPSRAGQRLKDGSTQIDLGNLRRDAIFWGRLEHLVNLWCKKQFSGVLIFAENVENRSQ